MDRKKSENEILIIMSNIESMKKELHSQRKANI